MVSLAEFVASLAGLLEGAEVPYMLTGSLAAAHYVAPRATQDIDVVIEVTGSQIDTVVDAASALGWYVDRSVAHEAERTRGLFNAIDLRSGWKADFIVKKNRAFSATEFSRRRPATLLGTEVWLASLEDVVISKLEWAALGDSDRQRRDVALILGRWLQDLDRAYVERWVGVLGLEVEWQRALSSAAP